jgi:hypothetical protein
MTNGVHAILKDSKADELVIVRGRGPAFALVRKGSRWFDVGGDVVEVKRG